jgi:hypothetical protein
MSNVEGCKAMKLAVNEDRGGAGRELIEEQHRVRNQEEYGTTS